MPVPFAGIQEVPRYWRPTLEIQPGQAGFLWYQKNQGAIML